MLQQTKVPRKSINRSYSKQFHTTAIGVHEWAHSLLHSRRAMLQKLYRQTIATIIQEWKSIGTSQWCCRISLQCQRECWCSSQSKKQVSNNSAVLSNQNWSANIKKQHTVMAICNAMLVSVAAAIRMSCSCWLNCCQSWAPRSMEPLFRCLNAM